ncbi:MAG: SLATT domain-containing protein [Halobacteria archaeon]
MFEIRKWERIEEDSLYSAKAHFYAAQFWTNLHLWIGIPSAVLAAIAGASALSRFDNHNIVAGVLSLIVAALTAIATFINPRDKASAHQKAGNEYNSLRNKVGMFYRIEIDTVEIAHVGSAEIATEDIELTKGKTLLDELKELSNKRDELNKESPQIPKWAYKKAKKGINAGEATYRSDGRSCF